jgi:hypothetical protein
VRQNKNQDGERRRRGRCFFFVNELPRRDGYNYESNIFNYFESGSKQQTIVISVELLENDE